MKKARNAPAAKARWDDVLVVAVMVVSLICIIMLLSSYFIASGKAYANLPSAEGVYSLLNGATVITGSGKTRCNAECAKENSGCILARSGEQLITCADKINGEYKCLCTNPERMVMEVPGLENVTHSISIIKKYKNCTTDSDCHSNQYCENRLCNEKKNLGDICGRDEECLTNKCVIEQTITGQRGICKLPRISLQ